MRHLLLPLTIWALARAHLSTVPWFGGEDPFVRSPNEENWHHEGLTRRGAASAGWAAPAINELAFHADYVDSYLYFPPWWLDPTKGGGARRFRAVWSSRHELKKLHFDDLNTLDQVDQMWQRYFSGTVAGLLWAASCDQDDRVRISMAHNVLGCSLHAVQDFYSHSNWVDDRARRARTWFDVPARDRARMPIWTGTYESAHHRGHAPHGEFLFQCALFGLLPPAGRRLMDLACASWSPLSGGSLCRAYDACEESENVPVPEHLQQYVPSWLHDKIMFLEPGINLDSTWQAVLGAKERELTFGSGEITELLDLSAEELAGLDADERTGRTAFETAYALASRASCQWLRAVEAVIAPVHPEFWEAVKHVGVADDARSYISDTGPWEDMAQLPYRFLTAGEYPPPDRHDDDGWYLRLHVDTADVANAGTNADIAARVDGVSHVLNHAPPPHPGDGGRAARIRAIDEGLAHDDHEQSTSAAYVIGPFASFPRSVTIHNHAPDAGDVFTAALESLGRAVTSFFENLGSFFLSLVGWHPDYVGTDHHTFDAEDLERLGVGERIETTLLCHHRSEGKHDVRGYVAKTSAHGVDDDGIAWRQYEVGLLDFRCRREADSDRGSNSDEPFFLALVTPHGGSAPLSWRSGVYSDVDSGEGPFRLGWTDWVRVPEQLGSITLAVSAWESDGESASDRRRLLEQFARAGEESLEAPQKDFLVTLTEAFASGWRPLRLEATAFRRGTEVEVVAFEPHLPDRWLMGGEHLEYRLVTRRHDRVTAQHRAVGDCPTMRSTDFAARFADLRGVVEVPRARWQHNPLDLLQRPDAGTTGPEPAQVSITPRGGWKVVEVPRLRADGPVVPPGGGKLGKLGKLGQAGKLGGRPGAIDRTRVPFSPGTEPAGPALDADTLEKLRLSGALRLGKATKDPKDPKDPKDSGA